VSDEFDFGSMMTSAHGDLSKPEGESSFSAASSGSMVLWSELASELESMPDPEVFSIGKRNPRGSTIICPSFN